MRFMVLVKATKESEERSKAPVVEEMLEMGKFNDELIAAGVMLAGEGLHPSSKGVRVKFGKKGSPTSVTDGPFTETKELVSGFWIWKVNSRDEAIAWLKRAPFQDTEIEIRQVFESADFEATTDEGRALLAAEDEYRKAHKQI
jgi:hypothetical protein